MKAAVVGGCCLRCVGAEAKLALLLQAIYGIRSERMLIEQLDDNLLFRWFVGLNPDDPVWHPTTYGLRPTSSTPKTVIGCSARSSWPSFWSCCWLLQRSSRW